MVSLPRLCVALVAAVLSVRAQTTVLVEDDGPSLRYSNAFQWDKLSNLQWMESGNYDPTYWHGGSARSVAIPGASVSFTFNGSRIAYYGDMNSDHGKISVVVDGYETIVDSFRKAGPAKQVKLFETDVDPVVANHVVTLTCLDWRKITLDYFEFDAVVPAPNPFRRITTSDSASSKSPPPSPPDRDTDKPIIVALAVGTASGWLLVILLGLLVLRLRRRREVSIATLPVHSGDPSALAHITCSLSPTVKGQGVVGPCQTAMSTRWLGKQRVFQENLALPSLGASGNGASTSRGASENPTSGAVAYPPAYS